MSAQGSEFGLPEDEQNRLLEVFRDLAPRFGWQTNPSELLSRWERTVKRCREGYPVGFDDYTNDLSVREIIQDVLDAVPPDHLISFRSRVAELDRYFQAASISLSEPIFDATRATLMPDRFFFYYRVPREPGEEMIEDLIRMRFISSANDLKGR